MSTNDKQYKAILNELKVLENQKDETVKRAVEEMSRIDETQKRIELHAATTAERAKVRELAKAKLDECMKDVGERLSELESERERAADLIPDRERKIFDRVAEETEGEAMADVTIVSLRHREFACGACNIEVPFETYAKLSSAADAVVQCKACTRILYLSEETRGASNEEKSAEKSAEKPKSESSRKTRATAGAAASSGGDLDPNSPEAIARDKAKFEKTRKL
jgi:predicted  nucleic acid-binding Zn-ribbon protein